MLNEEEKETPERKFAEDTSLHGFNKVLISPNRGLRTMWILAILGSSAGFLYMATTMVQTYFSYDTICDVKLSFEDKITFPAVTICNYNRIDSHKVTLEEWSALSPLLYGTYMDSPTLQAFLGLPDTPTAAPNTTANVTATSSAPSATLDMADAILTKGFDVSPARLYLCHFGGGSCTQVNFTHSFSEYGNCFTFNADAAGPLSQTIPGSASGFQVAINVVADSYTETIVTGGQTEVGLKVQVHDQSEPPMVTTCGISIAPGMHSFVSVKRTEYLSHEPPWGECRDLQLEYYSTYTLPGCSMECRSRHVQERCGCTPYFLPGTATPCDASTLFTCVSPVLRQVSEGVLPCDCPLPCSMTKYSTSLSFSAWPNQFTRDFYSTRFGLGTEYLRENLVVLSVYYEDLSSMKISQLKAMDAGQLASNMGGMMGLFIGASLLTLLEVSEYLGLRFAGFFSRKQRPLTVHVNPAPSLETTKKDSN